MYMRHNFWQNVRRHLGLMSIQSQAVLILSGNHNFVYYLTESVLTNQLIIELLTRLDASGFFLCMVPLRMAVLERAVMFFCTPANIRRTLLFPRPHDPQRLAPLPLRIFFELC
ncbi:hypothetical protein V6N12_075483 [Hibiscus sabdariffa]|uniref:Uncharacterized protein n=1 Tax=Hibiscus sabdariffa TaxID=183260 RepID=A0ABR2C9L0_9ROSI